MMMMKILLLLLLVVLGGAVIDGGNNGTNHSSSSSPGVEELLFDRFSAASNMTLNHGAVVDVNGTLRLTTPAGHAFYSTPFNNNFSFSSAFVIAITKSGAFAFTGNLSSKWFRVEFDTDEHYHIRVGINLNGVKNKCNASLQLELGGDDNEEELLIQAWVDYDSSINQLEVRLSPNSSSSKSNLPPLVSWNNDDLSPILVDETVMYVGFSALRGVSYIRGWSFKLNGKGKGKAATPSPPPELPELDQDAVQVQLSGGVTDPCLFLVIGFCGTLIIGTADWAYKTYAAG